MLRINITILLCITFITPVTATASSFTPQNCQCQEAYSPTARCDTHCAAEPIKKDPCPEGATYDDNLGLCTADPDNYGQCPQGMIRPLYKQKCNSKRNTDEFVCPPGGQFDKKRGYCIAPCNNKKQ